MHFPAKRIKYWNVHIIKTTASIITKFCRVIETPKYSLQVVQICPNESKMAEGRHLEKSKNLNRLSSQPIDRFWQNFSRWCVSTLWSPITNKISRFQKSKMAAAAILEIRKIEISPQPNDRFWRHLARWWVYMLHLALIIITFLWWSKRSERGTIKPSNWSRILENGRQTSQATRERPPIYLFQQMSIYSTAKGERGLISKDVHYQLVRVNRYIFCYFIL